MAGRHGAERSEAGGDCTQSRERAATRRCELHTGVAGHCQGKYATSPFPSMARTGKRYRGGARQRGRATTHWARSGISAREGYGHDFCSTAWSQVLQLVAWLPRRCLKRSSSASTPRYPYLPGKSCRDMRAIRVAIARAPCQTPKCGHVCVHRRATLRCAYSEFAGGNILWPHPPTMFECLQCCVEHWSRRRSHHCCRLAQFRQRLIRGRNSWRKTSMRWELCLINPCSWTSSLWCVSQQGDQGNSGAGGPRSTSCCCQAVAVPPLGAPESQVRTHEPRTREFVCHRRMAEGMCGLAFATSAALAARVALSKIMHSWTQAVDRHDHSR